MARSPLPLEFLVDGRGCPRDSLTACFPRTTRQAFGPYASGDPLPSRLTFHPHNYCSPWLAAVAVVALLACCWLGR